MNAPAYPRQGIPLRPDFDALERTERRSWQRAIAASVFACQQNTPTGAILKSHWAGDSRAAEILTRAATSATSTASFVPQDTVAAFRSVAPGAAAPLLFASANILSLAGIGTVKIPATAALPPAVVFVAEGAPGPAVQFTLNATTLGPARKLMVLAGVSSEIEHAGPELASVVIARVLADAANKSLDTAVFGTAAASSLQPAGLLHSVTPLTAAAAGPDAMSTDLSALTAAIAAAGIDATNVVFVADARTATMIKTHASLKFDNTVLATIGLPARTIAAFAPAGVFSGFDGNPRVETARETLLHMEDTSPSDISVAGAPPTVAFPAKSLFQSDLIAIRLKVDCAWCVMPGAAQVISSVNW